MYYFAYGSNINLDHMRRLCGWHFQVLGMARLNDYELGADHRGFATVRPQPGKYVTGVLYELDQKALDALDEFEGHPEVFGRVEVSIHEPSGETHTAWMYMEPEKEFGGKFWREEYLKRVVAGAVQNHLPEEWISYLATFHKPVHS